jgi:hypothetical protein
MQYKLGLGSREQVAFIRIMPNLLAVLTKDCGALEEEVTIASTAKARFFLCFLLAFWLVL